MSTVYVGAARVRAESRMTESPALARWQGRIDQYREQQACQGPPMWERDDGWYGCWVDGNDYHQQVLPYLIENLSPGDRVLEIGPGTGAFTVPLADASADILCLEPSKKMRQNLETKLQKRRLTNIEILPGKVESSLDVIEQQAPFQLTLASFSLYNVREIDQVLKALLICSQRIYILLGTGARTPWYRALIQEFAGEEPISAPQLDLLYPLLLEMGILADVRIIQASQNYLFLNEEDLVEYWQDRLNTPISLRGDLAQALSKLTVQRNGQLGIFSSRPVALVVIERKNQIEKK